MNKQEFDKDGHPTQFTSTEKLMMNDITIDQDNSDKQMIEDIMSQSNSGTTKHDQIYSSDADESMETKRLVPSAQSSKLTAESRSTGGRAAMVKARIKKPRRKKNEVAQPLAKDVILGKVDYDGSRGSPEETLDDLEERNDDMYGDRAKQANLDYKYGGNVDEERPIRTPELYQNPNSDIKSLTLPEEILRYDENKFPDNGAADTFSGASLQIDQLKKYMQRQGGELGQVLAEQQEAAGNGAAKPKKKEVYSTYKEPSTKNQFTLAQNLADIASDKDQNIYDNSLRRLSSIFNPEYKKECNQQALLQSEYDVKNSQIKCFNVGDRSFFYVLADQLSNSGKRKPFLSVFEYFSQENQKIKEIYQTNLNNKFLRIEPKHRQMVLIRDSKLLFVKIQNIDQTKKINYVIAEYDVVKETENVILSDTNDMEIQEDGTRVYAQFAIFSSNLQINDTNRFIMIFYSIGLLGHVPTNKDEIRYEIRKMSNFSVNLFSDELDFGMKPKNQQLTIDLTYLQPAQHMVEDLDMDVLLCQITDATGQVHQRQFQAYGSGGSQEGLVQSRKTQQIKDVSSYTQNRKLKPFYFYSSTFDIEKQVQTIQRQDISREEQHGLFEELFAQYCLKAENLETDLQSFCIIQDKYFGIFTLLAIYNNQIFVQNLKEASCFDLKTFDPFKMHPFTVAAYELGFGKQLDSEFNNVFFQRYEQDAVVAYLNKDQECFKQLTSDLANKESFLNYNLNDLMDQQEKNPKRMSLIRFDERPFYPRMRIDSNKDVFFEIVEKKKDKVVNTFAINEMTTNGNSDQFDNFCESSDIFLKRNFQDWKFQNFQWASIQQNGQIIEIIEFEVGWIQTLWHKEIQVMLVGKKMMILSPKNKIVSNSFYSMFDCKDKIIGTQFLPVDPNRNFSVPQSFQDQEHIHNKFAYLQLKNISPETYQLKNELCKANYQRFQNPSDPEENVMMFSVQLSHMMIINTKCLSDGQRLTLLNNQIKSVLNLAPIQMTNFFLEESDFNVHQQHEVLNGTSLLENYMGRFKKFKMKIQKQKEFKKGEKLSFIQQLGNAEVVHQLEMQGLVQQEGEFIQDLLFSNPIQKCFLLETPLIAHIKILIPEYLKFPKQIYRYQLLMSIIQLILNDPNPLTAFNEFFADTIDGLSEENIQDNLYFAYQLKDIELPQFGKKNREIVDIDQFQHQTHLQDVSKGIVKQMVNLSQAEKELKTFIPIQSYFVDFNHLLLNIALKKIRKGNFENQIAFNEIRLCKFLTNIASKYYFQIDKFNSLQNLIEAQYEKTKTIYSQQFAMFIFCFILPFLLGVLTQGENKTGTLVCNGLGVLTTLVFFIFEIGKLRAVGRMQYFEPWANWLEILMFPVFTAYTVFRFENPGSVLPYQYTVSTNEKVEHYSVQVFQTILTFIMFCWTLQKVLFFLRFYETFSLVMEIISKCLTDITFYCFFFLFCIFIFGCWNQILYINFQESQNWDGLTVLYHFIENFKQIFDSNTAPDLSFWNSHQQKGGSTVMVYLILTWWVVNQFFIIAILMNIFLAIIFQSYDKVLSSYTKSNLIEKCNLNLDRTILMKQFGTNINKFETLVFTSSRQSPSKTFEWHGFVQTIKECISSHNTAVNEQIVSQFQNINVQMCDVETKINHQMKSEIGKAQGRIISVLDDLNEISKCFKEKPKEIEWIEDADENSNSDQDYEELPTPASEPEINSGIFEVLEMAIGVKLDIQLNELKNGSVESINELQKQLQGSLENFVEVINEFNIDMIPKQDGTTVHDEQMINSLGQQIQKMHQIQKLQSEVTLMNRKNNLESQTETEKISEDIQEFMKEIKENENGAQEDSMREMNKLKDQMSSIVKLIEKVKKNDVKKFGELIKKQSKQ